MSEPARKRHGTGRSTSDTLKLVGLIALGAYAVLILILNSDRTKIDFLFFTWNGRLWVVLLLTLALGAALGYGFAQLRSHRRARPDS